MSVGDGDIIRVREGVRLLTIRLACIDAPEMANHPYGPMSREALAERQAQSQRAGVWTTPGGSPARECGGLPLPCDPSLLGGAA